MRGSKQSFLSAAIYARRTSNKACSGKKTLPPPPAGKKHWVCLGCGHIYEGDEPPEQCPFCKAPEAVFYPRQYYPRQQATGNDALQNALNLYEGMQQGIPGSSNDGTV